MALPLDPHGKSMSLAGKLAIAATLGIPVACAPSIDTHAQSTTARAQVRWIHDAVGRHQSRHGKLPQHLWELTQRDEQGNSLLAELVLDPWCNEYRLVVETPTRWKVISFGPDGNENTEDDISSAEQVSRAWKGS